MEMYNYYKDDRYFVDVRSGCAAIRDRQHPRYDPAYQGLHFDTIDVVEYVHGHIGEGAWVVPKDKLNKLHEKCNQLNLEYFNMSKKINITFDLETLGKTSKAPIVQIAAVKFKDSGEILDTFIRDIDLDSLNLYKFETDYSTILFWLNQSKEVINSVFNSDNRTDITTAINDFFDWLGNPIKYVFWTHKDFDVPILNNTLKEMGGSNYIHFKSHLDIRTLTHLAGKIEVERKGNHHNALDDCLYQVEYILKGLEIINNKKPNIMS